MFICNCTTHCIIACSTHSFLFLVKAHIDAQYFEYQIESSHYICLCNFTIHKYVSEDWGIGKSTTFNKIIGIKKWTIRYLSSLYEVHLIFLLMLIQILLTKFIAIQFAYFFCRIFHVFAAGILIRHI